jgi:hypothetical protein
MKSTISDDLIDWLCKPDDSTAMGVMKILLVVLFVEVSGLWGSRIIASLIFGRWDDASHAAFVVAQLAGVAAFIIWGDGALYRWRERTIARLEAERDALLAAQDMKGDVSP